MHDFRRIEAVIQLNRSSMNSKRNTASATRCFSSMGWTIFTALARTKLSGHLDYSERNIVEKLFQTYTMRIKRFHETWNGNQTSAGRWLTGLYGLLQPSPESSSTGEPTADHSTRTDGFNLAVQITQKYIQKFTYINLSVLSLYPGMQAVFRE